LAKYFSPFLKIGITFACLQSVDKDALNMVVRRGANSCAYCLRIREEISSGPVALDGSSLFSSFSVPLAVTVISKGKQT
jgi:hypothetical protein